MARYEVTYLPSVAKDLKGLPKADVLRLLAKAETLRDDPRPPGSQKLAGEENYRIRQGDYRLLYSIDDEKIIVQVVKVGHRKDVYRK